MNVRTFRGAAFAALLALAPALSACDQGGYDVTGVDAGPDATATIAGVASPPYVEADGGTDADGEGAVCVTHDGAPYVAPAC